MSWLESWKARAKANAERSEANQMMDSGWSANVADQCTRTYGDLLRELVARLADVPTLPADFFDRPELVEVIEAARFTVGPKAAQR